jgi:Bacterial protein of unknown function (DUF853)
VSGRLGGALAEYIRRMPGEARFVVVEGVPASLAEGMSRSWDDTLPPLAVVSATPARFGRHALAGFSGSGLRNRLPRGVVVVLCEGQQVPDKQSISSFESVTPGKLLEGAEGLAMIAQQHPPVALDGPARAVREAVNRAGVASRPSAQAVANYFDRLAAGEDPLRALPALGAFADSAAAGARVESDRIGDNLALAAQRTSEELLRPAAYADLRRRAEDVLGRRPGLRGDPAAARAEADEVLALLQAGSDGLLSRLQFDEARDILEKRPQDLAAQAAAELDAYRRGLDPDSQAAALPWAAYAKTADSLRRGPRQRDAARELCDLDDAQQRQVFARQTRAKLERLLRDKAVSGSSPSCPEAALAKAGQQLGGLIDRVQVLSPTTPTGNARTTRTGAGRLLTLACARLRLGALMRQWHEAGGEVDGLLLQAADSDAIMGSFADADLAGPGDLQPLQLRLYSQDGSTVQVDWKPDLDDAALLRAALLFAQEPALTLAMPGEPTLHAFCAADHPAPAPVPDALLPLARKLSGLARAVLDRGLDPRPLLAWTQAWTGACAEHEARGASGDAAEALALAGAVTGAAGTAAALTGLAPLKAQWLAQYHQALWWLVDRAERPDTVTEPVAAAAGGVARTTASHHPAHLRLQTRERALLPTSEGRVWSLYGGAATRDESGHAAAALGGVLGRLLALQPEAAGHLRCLAWGPGAADLLAEQAVRIIGTKAGGRAEVSKVEIFCVGSTPEDRPRWETLVAADEHLRGSRDVLELRYLASLDAAQRLLSPGAEAPAVHLALVTGLTDGGQRLQIESPEVAPPGEDGEVLFAPRTWQRPRQDRRTLLMPPAATAAGHAWLRLQNAVEDAWPEPGQALRVPEVRTGTLDIAAQLRQVHELALWVATLDRYATRDSLEQALGRNKVAILHQERRLGGDSPLSLVLSQKSGGPADRAIGRSLRAAGIVADAGAAMSIGTEIRQVASQGYGILALQAATSGAGINELVGHVVAFSLLATTATPWPLPPGCRVLLVSLDEYRHWFPGKRADLLAIALDPREGGVHVAAIEVKARRSDETDAAGGALDQLSQTLAATRWAAYPEPGSVYSRLWLNRITEAAYAVARESRFRLDAGELAALEAFRLGTGTLEWAGVGLVFGPNVTEFRRHYPQQVDVDIVPVALHSIRLTESLLRTATAVRLADLRTVEADRPPLQGGRLRRRPEAKPPSRGPAPAGPPPADTPATTAPEQPQPPPAPAPEKPARPPAPEPAGAGAGPAAGEFRAPLLGWDAATGEAVRWHPAGPGQSVLQNGHAEIWGSSGMGKTQFAMSLLGQLARHSGSRFGIADFKNDYSGDTGFPAFADAEFLDLWNGGAPYNPLALDEDSDRAIETAVIELRDTVDEATRAFTRMGVRQKAKLEKALHAAYAVRRTERRWPTLRTLDDLLDPDLAGVMGDLTRHELFKDGPPLGDVIDRNVVFGLSKIPGNGQTTVLAAGFILSALLLRVQNLPPVPNSVRYLVVVDEAHRVADFRAVKSMIREGRSKGLAVVLATQQPLDLPDVVAANAQTKVCFGLPDATVATMAARKLQPDNHRLSEQIRTLGVGEAFVSLRGEAPRLLRMTQAYRDAGQLGLPSLRG